MPEMDEGGFVIDYLTPWGTSLEETDRVMQQAEAILRATPEVEGYSRRSGARLALAVCEPNDGDFLVKLRPDRKRSTEEVKSELRAKFNAALPAAEWEFPGILMLDLVDHHLAEGCDLNEALAKSAHRRLRPILMTSMATLLAMLPLAWGIGHGADMLRPLAIGIIGALAVSVLFSLIATPVVYRLLGRER